MRLLFITDESRRRRRARRPRCRQNCYIYHGTLLPRRPQFTHAQQQPSHARQATQLLPATRRRHGTLPRHTPVIARDRVNHCLRSSQSPPPDADQIDQSIIFLLTRVIAPPVSANAAVIAAVTVYCSLPPTTSPTQCTVYIINLPENTRTGYLK